MRTLKITGVAVAVSAAALALLLVVGIPASAVNSLLGDRIARETGARVQFGGAARLGVFPLRVTLQDTTARFPAADTSLAIERIEMALPLAALFGNARTLSSVTLVRPSLRAPLQRERERAPVANTAPARISPWRVERLVVVDGGVALNDPSAQVVQRIDGIGAELQLSPDGRATIAGRARFGGQNAAFTLRSMDSFAAGSTRATPVEATFNAPGILSRSVALKAEVKINGVQLTANNVSGTIGDDAFNGWVSIDVGSKPLVKLDLDFKRLTLDLPHWRDAKRSDPPWSAEPFDLKGLNYIDGTFRLSASECLIGTLRIATASFDATLASGVLNGRTSRLGVAGGEAEAALGIDSSLAVPAMSLRGSLEGVRARPLLSTIAGFERLDGSLQAAFDLNAKGDTSRAVIGSLGGGISVAVRDGRIVGVNVADMIRGLTATTLNGWQDRGTEATDLSQASASFRFDGGQGLTRDLAMAGPLIRMTGAGTVDLPSETIAFRVEPKLVTTLQGQGAAAGATPLGFGVPVVIQGPWAAPRIYPEVSGILDNPEAAYARLRELGQGLFGKGLAGTGTPDASAVPQGQDALGGALGNLIQGLGAAQPPAGGKPGPGADAPEMGDIMKRIFGR